MPKAGIVALFAALLVLAGPASADPGETLHDVERELGEARHRSEALTREAETLAGEAARLRAESVAAARKAQELEAQASALEEEIARLDARDADRRTALSGERHRLAQLLAAVERIARHPPAALLAEPTGAADAVRGAILLRAAVPAVEAKARALGRELQGVAALRREIAARRAELAETGHMLAVERQRIAALAEDKARLEKETRTESRDEQRRAAALAAQAESLRELMARLEAERLAKAEREAARAAAAPQQPPAVSQALPARGEILRGFGDEDEAGAKARGITIRTRAEAQVTAPADGEVVFAGPFRGFGQLLIIATGADYHALLGGLARIDAEVGQSVLAGEPVGVMQGSSKDGPALYFELRRKGQPINPLPWLAAGNSKVNG